MRINNARRFLKVKPTFIAVPMLGLILGGCDLSAQSVPLASGDRSGVLALSRQVDCLDKGAAREPMIVEHPNGTLFVSGYGRSANGTPQTAPRLWKSADHGVTWQPVNVGTEADGASANSDVDLAIAPDGTLYLVSMLFDNKTLEGTHIVVGASSDSGNTWRWTMLSKKRFDDRPWVGVAGDGTAHVIWNDGSGVYHAMTHDRGKSWSATQQIHPQGGSSHLAVASNGDVAVRITPASASGNKFTEGIDLLAVSNDGGTTWEKRAIPGERDWAPIGPDEEGGATPRWVEPVAWDAKGDLYLLWTQVDGVWLGNSEDRGATWKKWRIAESKGDTLSYFPYLTARRAGELAAVWYSGAGADLHWQVCTIQVNDRNPTSTCSTAQRTDAWTKGDPAKDYAPARSVAGEYLPALFLNDGDLAVVTPVQNYTTDHFGFSFWRFKRNP